MTDAKSSLHFFLYLPVSESIQPSYVNPNQENFDERKP